MVRGAREEAGGKRRAARREFAGRRSPRRRRARLEVDAGGDELGHHRRRLGRRRLVAVADPARAILARAAEHILGAALLAGVQRDGQPAAPRVGERGDGRRVQRRRRVEPRLARRDVDADDGARPAGVAVLGRTVDRRLRDRASVRELRRELRRIAPKNCAEYLCPPATTPGASRSCRGAG